MLECYIGDGFWQQVLEPGGKIWTAGQTEVRALTRSREIALLSSVSRELSLGCPPGPDRED